MKIEFILYVEDQNRSKEFYAQLLAISPSLDVPGMTEFILSPNCKLGIMPNSGIQKILNNQTPNPQLGQGIPRCELYLLVDKPEEYLNRGIQNGALMVSEFQPRDWGDEVGYLADPDGHIIALAKTIKN